LICQRAKSIRVAESSLGASFAVAVANSPFFPNPTMKEGHQQGEEEKKKQREGDQVKSSD